MASLAQAIQCSHAVEDRVGLLRADLSDRLWFQREIPLPFLWPGGTVLHPAIHTAIFREGQQYRVPDRPASSRSLVERPFRRLRRVRALDPTVDRFGKTRILEAVAVQADPCREGSVSSLL